ncbi:hypothetical protein BGW39_001456, partial [Mortierella sp. 14UC]
MPLKGQILVPVNSISPTFIKYQLVFRFKLVKLYKISYDTTLLHSLENLDAVKT